VGVEVKDMEKTLLTKQLDLLLSSTGVDPYNVDAELSDSIEAQPPTYPSDSTKLGNFKERLKAARQSPAPLPAYRQIINDVVEYNYFLPLVHFSTTLVGRENIDFSQVPKYGEFRPYHAIRRKD
jgi:hypothetical protein